jgi:hypothetical protein
MQWLDAMGILHWRVSIAALPVSGGKFRRKNPIAGHPDLAGVIAGGRYFAIEVKRPGKGANLSEAQLSWKRKLEAAGVIYVIATSVQDVKMLFRDHVASMCARAVL